MKKITLVKWQKGLESIRCTVSDMFHRHFIVEMPKSVLKVIPKRFKRGSDAEHAGIIAAGAVLLNLDPEEMFLKVDGSMVNRAYEAASGAQILGGFGTK